MAERKKHFPETEQPDFSNREYKATTFTAYFGMPEHAADLYCALEHGDKAGPEDIAFTTLEGVLYLARKNDLAFTAKKKVLVIGEHQSTLNLNMPLRSAIYYGRTMERLVPQKEIYKSKQIRIPTPEFYVFYNGLRRQPAEKILKLSDSFLEKTNPPMLELKVKMININPSAGHPILQESRSLYEYSLFMQRIRDGMLKGIVRGDAIKYAMKQCLTDGIMTDFIHDYGSEVVNMLFGEFNLEEAKEVWREEGYEDGVEDGAEQKLTDFVCRKLRKGKSPEVIAEELEEDLAVIKKISDAAKAFAPEYDFEKVYEAWKDRELQNFF